MPTKSERTKVEVKESSTLDVRRFSITLTAPVSDFQLTDLLRQRGVINGLEGELKQAVKRATENYLKSAETLISGLAPKTSSTKKYRQDSNGGGQQSVTSKEV
jgi:hypothetical protein